VYLDFEIDKLTHSIENAASGEVFMTEIILLSTEDLQSITKQNGWKFNWKKEFADSNKQVYKLVIVGQAEIQGLLSVSIKTDHVFMNLLENAPFNIGKNKRYSGTAGNLVAYACKMSFLLGYDGYVAFDAKSRLIVHYQQSLGAVLIGGQRMIIETQSAIQLIARYYPDLIT
jgi:hypothetical protein